MMRLIIGMICVIGTNKSELCMPTCVEKLKSFRPQFPREVQNDRSQLFNTVAHKTNGLCGCNSSAPDCGGNKTALFTGPNCTGARGRERRELLFDDSNRGRHCCSRVLTLRVLLCCHYAAAVPLLCWAGADCELAALKLTAPSQYDFRPSATSPLVDKGAIVPPFTDGGYVGVRPDIGAYEHGGELWRAGCVGLDGECSEPELVLPL
jgi:hypothetical protein